MHMIVLVLAMRVTDAVTAGCPHGGVIIVTAYVAAVHDELIVIYITLW